MVQPVPIRNDQVTATILSGAALSDAITLYGRNITGILLPASCTTADITLSVSLDGSTYADLYDASGEYVLSAAASVFIGVNVAALLGFNYVKLRSGTTGTPVNQAADRSIILTLGDFTR